MRAVLVAADNHPDRCKAVRDVALIHILYDLALRRGEVCGLDKADLDLLAARLMVVGEG
jgi:integrase/recombinase XerC